MSFHIWIFKSSLFLHITFVFLWLATIPISFIVEKVALSLDDSSKQISTMKMSFVNGKLAMIAAVVTVLTGSIMIETSGYSWAPSDGTIWLMIKQTIWLILLVASFLLMKPIEGKINGMVDKGASFDEVFPLFKKIKIYGHILSSLVLLNILLATLKPF